jgi:hypothetical protein
MMFSANARVQSSIIQACQINPRFVFTIGNLYNIVKKGTNVPTDSQVRLRKMRRARKRTWRLLEQPKGWLIRITEGGIKRNLRELKNRIQIIQFRQE